MTAGSPSAGRRDPPGGRPSSNVASPGATSSARSPSICPARSLRTVAVWWTVPGRGPRRGWDLRATCPAQPTPRSTARSGCCRSSPPATAGTSAASRPRVHADTGELTVFVYDGHPGGAGFAERGFRAARAWLSATRDAIRSCGCDDRLPVLHPVAEVRQPEQPARQGRCGRAPRRAAERLRRGVASACMLVVGLLLIVAGALAIVAAGFTSASGTVELLGIDVSALTLFLIGVGSGVAILLGLHHLQVRHQREPCASAGRAAGSASSPTSSTSTRPSGGARARDRTTDGHAGPARERAARSAA